MANIFSIFRNAKCMLAIAFFCMVGTANAQTEIKVPFNGLILDVAGNPIRKVKVYNYDSRRFTFTDKKGRFGLTNVNADDTLHLVYKKVKYDIPVDGRKSMKIRLADQLEQVEEDQDLVDLGMMFVKRREFTGAATGLSGDELLRLGYTEIIPAIVNHVAGVSMYNGKLLIRGVNSLYADLEPLYVVDGVPVSSLDNVSLYFVDHIEVIKDANMYGARGANGVISVTTKRGKLR